ncbi:hypothetical protein [Falsiroseomonas sp. CW058]|uniref:hypothetical protein n=1 Tax=Falsiroseomonas sp. CW058 TaxID=3388664 RepID=UPI003D3113C4
MTILRPAILADFCNSPDFLDPRIAYSRPAGTGFATRFDRHGNMVTVPAGVPRIDNDLATLDCLGLLMEEATTNTVWNPRWEGTGGTALTSGNMPTNTFYSGAMNGITITRIADKVKRGMNGMVLRFAGTASANTTLNFFLVSPDTAASAGQSWTMSGYFALDSGSLPVGATASIRPSVVGGSAAIGTTDFTSLLVADQTPVRVSATVATDAGATLVRSLFRIFVTSGSSPVFDLWIGPAQMEQKAFATSQVLPVPGTIGANSSRSAETLSTTLADWGIVSSSLTDGMLLASGHLASAISAARVLAELSDGTANELIQIGATAATSLGRGVITDGGIDQATLTTASALAAGSHAIAVPFRAADFAMSVNGAAALTASAGSVPSIDRLHIGSNRAGSSHWNGRVRRVALYTRRIANAQAQLLTA